MSSNGGPAATGGTRRPRAAWAVSAPSALGCKVGSVVRATPQWLVFEAQADGGRCWAWAFLPAALAPDRLSEAPTASILGRAYTALATDIVASLTRLSTAREPLLCMPEAVVSSERDGLLWIRTAAPPVVLAKVVPLAPGVVAMIASGLVRALATLHHHKILHLDVHPDIIGCDSKRNISLCGVGTDVRRALVGQQDNRRLGRRGFSAPELWDASARGALGPWTDVYAAAATLYHSLTGAPPPDFRERMGEDEWGRPALVAAIRERFSASAIDGGAMAAAIADGLSPRPSDRPHDVVAWSRRMTISPEGGWQTAVFDPTSARRRRPGHQEEGPLGAGRPAAQAAAPAALAEPPAPTRAPDTPTKSAAPSPANSRVAPLLGCLALIGLAVALAGPWLAGRSGEGGNVQAPVSAPARPKPAAPLDAGAIGESIVERGRLAGTAFADDPERLGSALRRYWADSPSGFQPERLLQPYRDPTASNCAAPLDLHLREDGEGLIIERPAGLVWLTSWAQGVGSRPGEVDLRIEAVWRAGSAIEAPGLTGTRRRLRLREEGLDMIFIGEDGSAESEIESFELCAS